MVSLSLEDWMSLWRERGDESKVMAVFNGVVERYSEKDRFYHSLMHVAACLEEFKLVSGLAVHPFEVELALWFHDVVYDSRRGDNVEKSVEYATYVLDELIDSDSLCRVCDLIYATKHDSSVSGWDMGLLVDIDLAILGKPTDVFDKYEKCIRMEYSWVPFEKYCKGRAEILRGFLGREYIYNTGYFRWKYEMQARRNLMHSILNLETRYTA